MVKYFTSRLIYFHEPKASENKARECEISSHITLTSVLSGYSTLDIFTGAGCFFFWFFFCCLFVFGNFWCKVGQKTR